MPQRKLRAEQYKRRGLLAIDPKAFLEVFFVGDAARENTERDDAVIIEIHGPLEQHAHPWCDSYEDIIERVTAACATGAKAVVLSFDSPGGMAAGAFECAREVRALCDAAGKQLHAYVEGDCCSAAYAIAACCQSITIGDAALCGSIGVLAARDDYSAMNAANGLRVALVTSGARKADGHPDNPITDAELANTQAIVDSMGGVFFDHVAAARPGLTREAIAQLEAKVMHGAAAVAAGLADAVGSLATVLARVAGNEQGITNMAGTYEKARAALEEAAKGDDPNAKAAQRALAAMDADGGGAGDDEGGEKKEEQKDPPSTEGNPPAGDPPADDEEKKAAAAAHRAAIAAQTEVAKLRAELAKEREDAERTKLIASKTMASEMVALLQKAPIELVRETVAALPDSPLNPELGRAPTRGAGGGTGQKPDDKADLDARMGLSERKLTAQSTDYKLVIGPKATN